MLKKNKLNI